MEKEGKESKTKDSQEINPDGGMGSKDRKKQKDTASSVLDQDATLTRRHVESGTATEVRCKVILGRKAKVGELHGHALVRHQNVLRLQIPVVNPNGMAELYGIQELKEHTLDQGVIPDKVALVGDAGEQIAFGAELHHDVGTIRGVHDAIEGDDVGMLAGPVVETNLALLILELSGIQPGLVESFDGISNVRVDVQGSIYHSIGADAEDAGEFKPVGQDQS